MRENMMEIIFTKENIALVVSILGACAWIPFLCEKLRRPKIECKILKYDWLTDSKFQCTIPFENGLQKEINGVIFIIRMRITSRNNDFPIDNFQVKIKFCSMEQEIDAYTLFSSHFTVTSDSKSVEYDMDVHKNILFYPVLKQDDLIDLETHFIVESKKSDVEYIKFIFINNKNKKQIIKMKKEDFKYAHRIFM